MTSLGIALSVDSRIPSGLYIITDSRISWGTGGWRWDTGQKTFASARTPDVFGFCGDAFFPPAVLRQFLEQVDNGLVFDSAMDAATRHKSLRHVLEHAIKQQSGTPISGFSVFHGSRDHELMKSRFRLWETRLVVVEKGGTYFWTDKERDILSDHSYFVHVDGTGRDYVEQQGKEWIGTDAEGTSRAAIWAFCKALKDGRDPNSGGAPQIVGIWRKGSGRTFGVWWDGRANFAGTPIPDQDIVGDVDWFNERFERCDGKTGGLKRGAAKHCSPRPVGP